MTESRFDGTIQTDRKNDFGALKARTTEADLSEIPLPTRPNKRQGRSEAIRLWLLATPYA